MQDLRSSVYKLVNSIVFWQLFFVGLTTGLFVMFPDNIYVKGFAAMIVSWFGPSVGVGLINKHNEKKVEVASIIASAPAISEVAPIEKMVDIKS